MLYNLVDIGYTLAVHAFFAAYNGPDVTCLYIIGIKFEHTVKVGQSAVIGVNFGEQQRTVEKSRGVIRLEPQCIVVVSHGSEIIVERIAQECAVDIQIGIFRLKAYGLVEVFHCAFIVLTLLYGQFGAHHIGSGRFGVQLQSLVDIGSGCNGVGLGQTKLCAAQITVVEVGIVAQKLGVSAVGTAVTFNFHLCQRFVEQKLTVAGYQLQSVVVVLDSLGITPQVLTCHTAHLPGIG